MCGILGVINKKGNELDINEIVKMRDAMTHRGPDDSGIFLANYNTLALAHRRLSIIDLSKSGKQPMISNLENWISYNGEIYNYIELKNKYLKNAKFNSPSDTEVLLQIIEKYGTSKIKEFNGMWAFIYYDDKSKKLIICRDRFGVKPLYYFENGSIFIIASEIKSILQSKFYNKKENEEVIKVFMEDNLEDTEGETFFKGIKIFPKASYMIYNLKDNTYNINKYYDIKSSIYEVKESYEENIEQFKELFFNSIKLRLRSDVKVGVTLSGGIDSSAVYCAASKISNDKIHSFSAKFLGKDYDESFFYKKVWEKYPGFNKEIMSSYEKFEDTVRKIIYYLEEPNKAPGIFPQWNVMKKASKHVKVLLDGQGADELLAGYDPFLYYYLADIRRKNFSRYNECCDCVLNIKGEEFMKVVPRAVEAVIKNKRKLNNSYLQAKLLYEFSEGMLPPLLKYEDKMSMAFSVETRLPFLDYRLVNFAFSLDETYKIKNGWSKSILRESMKNILPDEIILRKDKKGYPTPLDEILKENSELYRYIPNKKLNFWNKWKYISLNLWREIFF
jgi:asparagine synthase (glutamine-hydrolysing)